MNRSYQIRELLIGCLLLSMAVLQACGGGSGGSSGSSSSSSSSSSSGGEIPAIEAQIVFPPAGSNLLEAADQLHIRGKITYPESSVQVQTQDLSLTVDGVEAEFIDDTSDWIVEIPLSQGTNTLSVSLTYQEQLTHSFDWPVNNRTLPDFRRSTADSTGNIYSIDIAGTRILKIGTGTSGSETLLTVEQALEHTTLCEYFNEINLSNAADKLLISCAAGNGVDTIKVVFFIYDINTQSFRLAASNIPYTNLERTYYWIENTHLLFRISESNFIVIDLVNSLTNHLTIVPPANYDTPSSTDWLYIFDGTKVYFPIKEAGSLNESWYSFEPPLVLSATDPNININVEVSDVTVQNQSTYAQIYSIKNKVYQTQSNELFELDLNTLEYRTISLSQNSNTEKNKLFRILTGNDNSVVLRTVDSNNELLTVNLNTADVTYINRTLSSNAILKGRSQILISPDNTKLIAFNETDGEFSEINATDYKQQYKVTLEAEPPKGIFVYSSTSMDWDNNILYRLFHYPNIASYSESNPEVLYSYDINSSAYSVVLKTNDLETYFSSNQYFLHVGNPSFVPSMQSLWFPINGQSRSSSDDTQPNGVYALNLNTKELSTIYHDSRTTDRHSYAEISNYSDSRNGVIYTEQAFGEVAHIQHDGTRTELFPAATPFSWTSSPIIDEQRNCIYFIGSKAIPESPGYSPDPSSFELVKYDFQTDTMHVLASQTKGHGISISSYGKYLDLDESRDLLYGAMDGYLFIIDAQSGDRVIRALE